MQKNLDFYSFHIVKCNTWPECWNEAVYTRRKHNHIIMLSVKHSVILKLLEQYDGPPKKWVFLKPPINRQPTTDHLPTD